MQSCIGCFIKYSGNEPHSILTGRFTQSKPSPSATMLEWNNVMVLQWHLVWCMWAKETQTSHENSLCMGNIEFNISLIEVFYSIMNVQQTGIMSLATMTLKSYCKLSIEYQKD